ncbi:pyocin knob domain-containing protein [Providencia manganoxydans]|uniref:pyocin knob domain-containing protein n=1 Tax=Providencia manganoxydans TaxID=2923283 RepID=UPI0034E5AC8D
MSVIKKPDLKIFAQDAKTGEVETFPDILRGWGVTLDRTAGKPPLEWFNAIGKRVDEWLMYLTQRGVAEWDTTLSYPKTAIVQFNSVVYVSIKETKGEQPDKSQASWSTLGIFLGLDKYSTTAEMNLALLKKIDKANITNQTGNSTELVASQQLITTEIGKLASKNELKNTTSQTIFARAEAIPQNADLNDYKSAGLFYQASGGHGANAKNYPPGSSAGSLEVVMTGTTSVKQIYTEWYEKKTYTRRYNGGDKTWADKWDEDFTKLNPPAAEDVGAYSTQQADAKFQPKGNYLDKDATQEQTTKGFLTAHRRLSVEAPDKARAILYAVESGNVGISAQDSSGKWLGDIKHPANGKNGTLAIVEQLIGEGQKWVDVTSQRRSKVIYTNETSRPILVCVTAYGEANDVHFLVNDTVVALIGYNSVATIARPLSVIVPAGAKYSISNTIGSIYTWSELR